MAFEQIAALTDKKAETFIFSDEERQSILSDAEEAGFTWQGTEQENQTSCVKQLEQLMRKELGLSLHASTLTQYLKVQRIPRGLRSNLTPILLKDDVEYQQKWYALSNRYSLDLMYLTVQHLQIAVKNVKVEVEKTEVELKNTSTPEDFNKIHEELKVTIHKLKEQLMANKLKKYERDTKDYLHNKVYTWAEERRKYRRAGTWRNDTSTDDTEGEDNSRNKTQKGQKNKTQRGARFLDQKDDTSSSDQQQKSERSLRSQTKNKKKTT